MSVYVMGIDGGGSKTEAAIMDSEGRVLGKGLAGGCNVNFCTRRAAVNAYKRAVKQALRAAGLKPEDIAYAGCTFAMAAPAAFAELGITADWSNYGESAVAFERAGIWPGVGVVVIAGTGSTAIAHGNRDRQEAVAASGTQGTRKKSFGIGGWGAVLGDDGGGYDIARRAIRRALAAEDGRMPLTSLTDAAKDYFEVDHVYHVIGRLLGTRVNQSLVAGFAVRVGEEAARGDEAALRIVREAGTELGEMAAYAAGRVFEPGDQFPFVLAGGVFNMGSIVIDPLRAVVEPRFPRSRAVLANASPGEAVARMVLRDYLRG